MISFYLKKLFITIKKIFAPATQRPSILFSSQCGNCFPPCFHFIVLRFLWQPCSYFANLWGGHSLHSNLMALCICSVSLEKLWSPVQLFLALEVFHQTFHRLFYYLPPIFINVSINFSFCQQVKKKQTTKH